MKKSILFLALIALLVTAESTFALPGGFYGVPDGGSTVLMLSAGVFGLVWCKNRLRR